MEANWTCFFFGITFAETATLIYQYPKALYYFVALVVLGLLSKTVRNFVFFFISLKLLLEAFSLKEMWKLGEIMLSLWENMEEEI
jgi:hypothetical protein